MTGGAAVQLAALWNILILGRIETPRYRCCELCNVQLSLTQTADGHAGTLLAVLLALLVLRLGTWGALHFRLLRFHGGKIEYFASPSRPAPGELCRTRTGQHEAHHATAQAVGTRQHWYCSTWPRRVVRDGVVFNGSART